MIKYWNVWNINQVILGKPNLHDLLCKLFFEQRYGSCVINYVYMFVTHHENLILICNWQKEKIHAGTDQSLLNSSSAQLRDKNTKFTLPFYRWNIRKSCYLLNPGIKAWNTDFLKIWKPWHVTFSSGEDTLTGILQVIFVILIVIVY